MTQSEFIAVIDLGTSKIKGVVGRKNENRVISILASEVIDTGNSIRRGVVYNIEEAGASIRKLLTMLENSTGLRIGKVYVSLNGQSLHTMEFRETKALSSGEIVTQDVVDQLNDAAKKYTPDLKRNYAVADVEYFIDSKPDRNPVGVTGSEIEAAFQVVVGRPNLLSNIEKSVAGKAKLPIADYIVGALASAEVSLNEEEKELGCAFIDFGAGTTTVSIYKDNILRRSAVIPFGGKTITKDISALNLTENDAEQLKIKYGKAIESRENSLFSSPFSSKPDVDHAELIRVISLRLDEITANIMEQIKLSGCENKLGAGVVITGGASQLKNLSEYLTQKLKMNVRKATAKKSYINNAPDIINNPSFTQALGMLLLGEENCKFDPVEIAEEQIEEQDTKDRKTESKFGLKDKKKTKNQPKQQKQPKQGIFSMFEDALGKMFSDEDE